MQRAVIYCRVSTDRQEEEGSSLDTQLAGCRAYAEERGYTIVGEYRESYTGSKYRERPQLTGLRDRVRSGEVEVVLCYALDRLSRDQMHTAVLVDEFEHHGARVELVTESFDDTSNGRLIRSVQGFVAEVEREKIIERGIRGQRDRVQSGRLLGGNKPLYGYRYVEEEHPTKQKPGRARYEIEPDEAQIVRRIYAEAVRGTPLRSIAIGLSAEGIPTPSRRSDRWSHQTVRHTLTHPGYKGEAYGMAWRPTGPTKTIRLDYENAILLPEGTIPAIVDPADWARVQARLAVNRERSRQNTRNPEEVLLRGGYLRCGVCGGAMVLNRRSNGKRQYSCTRRSGEVERCPGPSPTVNIDIIEPLVWARVEEILTRPELIRAEVERLREDDPTAGEVAALEERLTALDRRRRLALMSLEELEDPQDRADARARLAELTEARRALEEEQSRLVERQRVWHDAGQRLEAVEAWCHEQAGRLDSLSYSEKRERMDQLGIRARVFPRGGPYRYMITADIPDGGGTAWEFGAAASVSNRLRSVGQSPTLVTLRWTDEAAAD